MGDFVELAFEMGKIVYKIIRLVDASKGESAKLIRTLGGSEQEQVVLQKIGKYWNRESWFDRPDGLVVVTDHRLVFLTKLKSVLTTTNYLSFPLEMIYDLEATSVMWISPAITFKSEGVKYAFTFLGGIDDVVDMVNAARQALLRSGYRKEANDVAGIAGMEK